jgi:uncharacterized protein
MIRLLLALFISPAFAQITPPPVSDAFTKAPLVVPLWKDLPATGDKAFGAYQRGYYLTAFQEAVIEVETKKSIPAMVLLAELYSGGLGVPKNDEKAHSWYKAAADKGDRNAIYALGLMHIHGRFLKKDKDEAFKYFEKSADMGHLASLYNLGLLYMERGEDVKAADSFEKSANAGLADAQYALSQFFNSGRGRVKDIVKSTNYLEKAAKQNLTEAEVEYGLALFNGKGTTKNESEGVKYLKIAALKGNAIGQNRYARALAAGIGVKADAKNAALWHAIATLQGISDTWLDDQTAKLPDKDKRIITATAIKWYNFTNQ